MANPEPLLQERSVVLELPNGALLRFCPIPPGRFRMGSRGYGASEEPPHWVTIPPRATPDGTVLRDEPAFWLGETAVTQAAFAAWTESEAYRNWFAREQKTFELEDPHRNHFAGKVTHPAESVTWFEALAYCDWLNAQVALMEGQLAVQTACSVHATLPAEAHWEYACRAGSKTEYHSGDGERALASVAWFGEDFAEGGTHPVGEKQPNEFGLFDMHGNVWEWCLDEWKDTPYRNRVDGADAVVPIANLDPSAARRPFRVMRGRSWVLSAGDCRAAARLRLWPRLRNHDQGFRVCLLPGPVQ